MRVVDASVVVDMLLRTGDVDLQRRFFGDRNVAPHLLDPEVTHVVRRTCFEGKLSADDGRRAAQDLSDLPITRHGHRFLVPRVWALRDRMSAYDAFYVALAETLDAPLWTRDQRLAAEAKKVVAIEVG